MTKRDASGTGRSFPRKRLLVRGDTSNIESNENIDAILEEFKKRIRSYKTKLQNGNLDAPDMLNAIYLGKINEANPPIFKVNVPGWLYRFSPSWSTRTAADDYGVAYSKGKTGILLSYDPKYLLDNSDENKANRIMYMTAWDGQECSNANAMFPINPGGSTYMYITRDTTIGDNDAAFKEFYFIPTRLATCMNIHPNDYIFKVGTPTNPNLDLVDTQVSYVDNPVVKNIFDSKFTDQDSRGHMKNFAAVRSYFRVRRDKVKFAGESAQYQTEFYASHPEKQLENDDYEDFWRYGWIAARLKYDTGVAAIAREAHSTLPWETRAFDANSVTIQQVPVTLSGVNNAFKAATEDTAAVNVVTPDGLNWGCNNYTIGYYAEMWVEAGNVYKFSGRGSTTAVVVINGVTVYTLNTSSNSGSWTATTTGWVPISIAHYSKTGATVSGGSLVLNVTNSAGKSVYKNILVGNDVDRQLFRVPTVVNFEKYKQYNRFLKVKQLLI